MDDMTSETSRYLRVSRRSMLARTNPARTNLARTNLARTAAAGALLMLPVACGTGDEAAFSEATTTAAVDNTTAETTISTEATDPTTPSTTAAPDTTVADSVAPSAFPAGGELLVSFTYEPESTAQAKRPFIAVWVEDLNGNLVDTVSLWFEQGKGVKWLDDLRQWYSATGGSDTTMSGATRVAGEYTVAWDGTDADGKAVPQGDYILYIESAREHGPHSITSGTITISDDGSVISLADDGELSGASAELAV